MVWLGCIGGTLIWNTYQEEKYMSLHLGWWAGVVWGRVVPSMRGRLGYLSCNVGVSCKMLSHICGSWYFPRFLFNEGSFTQMNMSSLMFLEVPCTSLCMMVKQSGLSGWPVELLCWWMGDGALRCSLILSPKALPDSSVYSSGQLMWGHLKW